MIIYIEGKPALLKKGSSFELIAENRLFMGRDTYSLNLTFPLRDCPTNRAIFGNIERVDITKEKVFYECEIREKSMSVYGSILITNITEAEIKGQFVEGRCEQTSKDPFEKVYINELDLGSYPDTGNFSPSEAWSRANEVALPWINESYPTQFNNWAQREEDGSYVWANVTSTSGTSRSGAGTHPPTGGVTNASTLHATDLSWQPYLIYIAKQICIACGYEYDFSDWEASGYKYLLICNTLPYSWNRRYRDAMPHWTVTEFFEKLELLLTGEFDIDHRKKMIKFGFTDIIMGDIDAEEIEDVVEEYEVEITNDEQNCAYIGAKRLAYKDGGHDLQNFYACDWYVSTCEPRVYDTLSQLVSKNKRHMLDCGGTDYPAYGENAFVTPLATGVNVRNDVDRVLYAQDVKQHYVFRSIGTEQIEGYRPGGYAQIYVLQPINAFGSGMPESDDIETEEIDFVPVCIIDTYIDEEDDMGLMMALSFGSYEGDEAYDDIDDSDAVRQPMATSAIEKGEKENGSEYYSLIYVGFWDGAPKNGGKDLHPIIQNVNVSQDWSMFYATFPSIRLNDGVHNIANKIPQINPKQKFKFSFLANKMPNPRAVFYVRGKKYICEKITASFTEEGMSQLMKGDFYQIV